ncbi:MAG: T9SS type A sorting domain-containing protein [Saprospiraceae bacterium]|nr:T9SS type A sorting domain-containing protein [Saprospiraceae bacterium]
MKNQIVFFLAYMVLASLSSQDLKPIIDRSEMKIVAEFPGIITSQCLGFVNPPSLDLNLLPSLVKVRNHHQSKNDEALQKIKALNYILKKQNNGADVKLSEQVSPLVKNPVVGVGLKANKNTGGTPMDNTISISNSGWVVSAANSSINYVKNGVVQYIQNFESFLNNEYPNTCDPVVIWDPEFQKFFMYIQQCGLKSNNKIALLFSKSSNPNDGWWFYSIKADPSGGFFDYPKVGQSTKEIFVTGNVYVNSKYDHSNIFQIDKSSGYSGQTLRYTTWNKISSNNQFTLLPLNYGLNATYGPGTYLVCTESSGASYIGFYDLTDDLDKNPKLLYQEIPTATYGPGSDADQRASDCKLDAGDCRTQSGYYINERIHFVCNSVAPDKWGALAYFQLDVNTKKSSHDYFASTGWDYAYPSIAFYGKTKTDNESMIFFQRSNEDNYPENRVVYVDGNFNFSGSVLVYSLWETECEQFGVTVNRWGDYTGITRNYSLSSPSVWVGGAFGDFDGYWNTYIAEVHDSGESSVKDGTKEIAKSSLYPNPANKRFNLKFSAPISGSAVFEIFDNYGKRIHKVLESKISQGDHIFAFETSTLLAGEYFLQIQFNNQTIINEKFIVLP